MIAKHGIAQPICVREEDGGKQSSEQDIGAMGPSEQPALPRRIGRGGKQSQSRAAWSGAGKRRSCLCACTWTGGVHVVSACVRVVVCMHIESLFAPRCLVSLMLGPA